MGIFEKNIKALSLKDSSLALRLQSYLPVDVPELVKENNFYNLKYKGIYLHNRENPILEAQSIFAGTANEPVSIHFIYGIGLGYLFQVASLNSKGTVILYEPDLNLLRMVFNLVDFSNDLLRPNVFLTDDFNKACEVIYKKSGTKNFPYMISLPSQREMDVTGFELLVRKLKDTVGSYFLDLKYTKERFYPSLRMLLYNIPELIKEVPLVKAKDIYKGKTAVVVSAGPTLDRNIETLKKHRDKYVLFVVGTAIKTLSEHDITPDYICIIESYNSSRQLEGVNLKNTSLITEPYSHYAIRKFPFKKIFSHISANSPINHFWAEVCGENIEEYWSKGTVSYTALNSARILGCSKIILVGQDLAYIEGQCYSKDSAYKDLICVFNKEKNKWEIEAKDFDKFAKAISPSEDSDIRRKAAQRRLANLNKSLYYVKGIKGDMIPTESVYAAFVKPLSEFVHHFKDREYINTSLVGAQIDGFKNMSLEEALQDSLPVGDIRNDVDFRYDTEKIKTNLKTKFEELKTGLKIIEEGQLLIKSMNNEIKRHRNAGEEVLKSFKKVVLNYTSLSGEFSDKSKMFDFMTAGEKIDLDYEMKMTKVLNIQSIQRISGLISDYYEKAVLRFADIEKLIKRTLE